jgi:hypothetical protein
MLNRAIQAPVIAIPLLLLLTACADTADPTLTPVAPTATSVPVAATASAVAALPTPTVPATPTPLVAGDPGHYALNLDIDLSTHHPISPLIYGVADSGSGDEDLLTWLGATLVRWGGNARSMHNWEINDSNTGADGAFHNVSQGDNVPGSASLQFMERNERLGAASLLTIPTIGWVARDSKSQALKVPAHGGPPIAPGSSSAFTDLVSGQWVHPYDPTANRTLTSLPSFARKGAPFAYPPNLKDGKVYQDEWVAYLHGQRSASSPAPIYAMDNEPELWSDNAHVDVHPVRPGYDDMLNTFLDYARAVKDADPAGLVAGPESWGVTGYMYSALDEGGDRFETAADHAAHGNLPWLAWFLKATHDSDQAAGRRSLDVLDVHYYPNNGEYTGGNDPKTQDLRIQAPRALWDSLYKEPGWVAGTEWGNLALLRRLHNLIDQYYPGTKLAISEWNFGGENDISGALATADALGIFGREDAYYANYWQAPPQGSASGWAFRLYRNYDGQGGTFGSESVAVTGVDDRAASAYAALDATGNRLTVLLINKDRDHTADVLIRPAPFLPQTTAHTYQYNSANLAAIVPATLTVTDPAAVVVSLPPLAITLVVLDRQQ